MEKKKRYLIIGICAVIGTIIGVTSAWYAWTSGNTDVTLTIGGVTITYEAGDDITGRNLRPVSTKEVGVTKNYAIKKDITVSSSKTAYLNLYLNAEVFGEGLKHESLKWELYEEESLLNSGNFGNTTQGDTITLLSNTTINSTTRSLSLYIWIDGTMGNPSSMQNQEYRFVLNADATDNTSSGDSEIDVIGANTPDLMDGMVPVMYKKCSEIDGVSENTYPECYTKTYSEINDTDRAGLASVCVAAGLGTETECGGLVDALIENGKLTIGDINMTLQDVIELYETLGGIMTSPHEKIFRSDKETGDLVVASSDNWYNYSEQKWANAVLVNDASLRTASEGTSIPEDKVLAYYVWIPRYKYKLFNAEKTIGTDSYNARNTGIDIVFESGTSTTGTVRCSISSAGVETCENATNGAYYTHPAFTFGDKQLKGIWVGKFEISAPAGHACASMDTQSLENCDTTGIGVRIKPNVIGRTYTNVSNFFTDINNMTKTSNEYGLLNTKTDSHMMKNMEYGAVAYLANSKYGRCATGTCEEIMLNNTVITGNAGSYFDSTAPEEVTAVVYAYNTTQGVKASSTGNIYGVYDLNGGFSEYLMANMISPDGVTMMSGYRESSNSGYNGILYSSGNFIEKEDGVAYPDKKYYDIYAYGTTYNDQAAYSGGHLGDATGEVVVESMAAWNSDAAVFVRAENPWFIRGGFYNFGVQSGPFLFDHNFGDGYYTSSARGVLVSLDQ